MTIDCQPHLHIAAYHATPGYNNDTPGIGVLCDASGDWRMAAGTYFNSLRKRSDYAGFTWQPWSVGTARVGAFGGIVTGYTTKPIPFAAGVASIPIKRAELHFAAIPGVPMVAPSTLEVSISFKFN